MSFCENESIKLDYVNGLLTGETRKAFEHHLTKCEDCRQEIVNIRLMISAVRRIPKPIPTRELVEHTRIRFAQTADQWSPNHLLRNADPARRIYLVPSILTSILLAMALTALFAVFHDYVAAVLQKTLEFPVAQLLWGIGSDSSGAPLPIPIAAISFILALLLIPSLFENTRSLNLRLSRSDHAAMR